MMAVKNMNKFGFSISAGRYIDYDFNNRDMADYLFEKEPSFRRCIECGGCSATCSTGNFTGFSLREIFIFIKRGENNQAGNKLKKCMLCGKCTLVCPRGVNTRNIIMLARKEFPKTDEYAI
jgi:heterodisulfide reductase subunit C